MTRLAIVPAKAPRRAADPRHVAVREVLAKYWAAENPDVPAMPWGPQDAGALGAFLRACPALAVEEITQLLRHRLRSDDHAAGEPVFVWIKYLTRYLSGPLDKFKQPKGKSHAKPNRADTGGGHATRSTSAALARVRGVAGD